MLHSLVTEIVRRRLWPIPLIALAVAVGAPLLFLKSSPVDAPSAAAPVPAVAGDGELPARAKRLLARSDRDVPGDRRGAVRGKHDPFVPPRGHRSSGESSADDAKTEAATKDPSASKSPDGPVPVVITNGDGGAANTDPMADPPISGDGASTSPLTASSNSVDVRFGEKPGTKLRRQIPRLQTFVAGGSIVAVFVEYSPKRDKAVFAVAPSTIVTGDVDCRREEGLCRFVDIPVGSYARLTSITADGSLVTRRLDVVRVHRGG